MRQHNISVRNIARLEHLAQSPIASVRELAEVVLEVAQVKPGRRKRIGFLARKCPSLLQRLEEFGLVEWCDIPPDVGPAEGVSEDDEEIPF